MKKNLFTLLMTFVVIFTCRQISAGMSSVSNGELLGYVKDSANAQPIPFAVVVVKNGETIIGGANSDAKGMYKISAISPGTYTVEATFINYRTVRLTGVTIAAEQTLQLDIAMAGRASDSIIVIGYKHPLIDRREVTTVFRLYH
jgi:hypothetical protein